MIQEYPQAQGEKILPLFRHHRYLTLLLEAILKERVGHIHVDSIDKPQIVLVQRKVLNFLAGDSQHPSVPELLAKIPPAKLILVPDDCWVERIRELWGEKLHPYPRTKFSSEQLERAHMQKIVKTLPEGLILEKLTAESSGLLSEQAKFIISILFTNLESFLQDNFGFCIRDGEKIVSLALAASPLYDNHFEIHIETEPEYQRKGLAMISCAKLIEYSLKQGFVPHWDADNEPSAKLAQKLGFTKPEKYHAYIWREENK